MRDAYGGIVNLVIIVVFLVIVSGYLAFNVNYTKAFRVKNKIITTLEEYEGNCDNDSPCDTIIRNYMTQIGYSVADKDLNIKDYSCHNGYCIKEFEVSSSSSSNSTITDDTGNKVYYNVITRINLSIPIVNQILPDFFEVSGNTKVIEKATS